MFIVPIEKNAILTLNNVYFDTDKAILRKESFIELDGLATIIKENPTMKIEISGHTDDIGSDAYNLNLSRNRAKSVTAYLLEQGVPVSQVISTGYGETKPTVLNNSDNNRQKTDELILK